MDWIAEPLGLAFMRRALLAGVAVAGAGSLVGVFVVQRGLAFLSDGLAHATFGGLALGLLLGATAEGALWTALPFTVAVALGVGFVRRRSGLGGDVATGVFFAVAFALGVLFLGLRSARAQPVDVEALLFGSILAVSPAILAVMLVLAAVTVAVVLSVGRALAYATFDAELAALSGVRVAALEYLLFGLTATIVVVGVKTVGVVLVSAFVVIPAATARLLTRSFGRAAALAVVLSTSASAIGLLASYHLNVATGATIILVLGAAFFAAVAARRVAG